MHDVRRRFVDCNAAACRALGYTREELLGLLVADIAASSRSDEQGRVRNGASLWERATDCEPGPIAGIEETYLRRKDGTIFPVEMGVCTIEDDGRWLVCASIRETTNRKHATEALRQNVARFRSLTELSSDWFWEQDEKLRFTYLSNQADNLTGYTGQSSIGKLRWELEGMSPLSGSWSEHMAVLAARQPFRDLELVRVAADGGIWYLSISGAPIFGEDGRFKGYQGTGRNITERKRIEEELRSRQEMLDLAQRSAGAVPWQWRYRVDAAQNQWSSELEAMFGVSFGSFDGTSASWRKFVHPDDWLAVTAALRRARKTGEIDLEYRVAQPDGSIRWLQQKGRMLMAADGNPERSSGSCST